LAVILTICTGSVIMNGSAKNNWEHFHHQADIGIRGIGATTEQAFEQAAVAMTAVIAEPDTIEPAQIVQIDCEAEDDELLFVEFLNKLLYEMDTRKMLFSRFEVKISPGRLEAKAWGEKLNVNRHAPVVEVKAATYSCLSVHKDGERWVAQCVVDV